VCITDRLLVSPCKYGKRQLEQCLFAEVLLVVYNFPSGTNLPEFGVGSKPMQAPEGLVMYVEMAMRSGLQGDRAEKPAAAGGGQKLTDKGCVLRWMPSKQHAPIGCATWSTRKHNWLDEVTLANGARQAPH